MMKVFFSGANVSFWNSAKEIVVMGLLHHFFTLPFFCSFAVSCDALKDGATSNYCECKPNYVGERCEKCGAGYFGRPEEAGEF